jgi:alpha-ketoglutarate-dependent taurine dioxygenase
MTTDTRLWAADSISEPTWRIKLDATSLAGKSREILNELRQGRGFVVLRGLTLVEFIQGCQHLGQIIPQTNAGDLSYSVRDEGLRIESDYGKPGVRTSKTNAGFDFHTDSPSRLAGHTPEFIALYVSQVAKSGGESALVNAYDVHEIIERERPDLLARLYEPYWVDRRAEVPPGEEPIVPAPVFSRDDNGALTVRYLRLYIAKGHEQRGARLEGPDLDALDFFESVMNRPGLAVTIPMERDDVQIINNRFVLHSRTEFVDYPEPDRKRHYVRIWLNDIQPRNSPTGAASLPLAG